MFKETKRKKKFRYYRRRRMKKMSLRKYLSSRLVDLFIVLLVVLLSVYAFSLLKKLYQPTVKQQEDLVFTRTQILNTSHRENAVKAVIEKLKGMKVNNIDHQIVEVDDLEAAAPKESMILDRMGNGEKKTPSQAALLTAEALGIQARNVIIKELEDNYQGISLTIVIGDDWKILFPGI
jgi:cell division protein FtsB